MSLIEELKRRNVFRVGIAYVVIGWLLAQVAEFATENFGAPEWVLKIFVVFLLLGFVMALFFAWAFELTPEGLKKEKDVDRSKSITSQTGRKLDFTIIAVLVMALGYFAWDKFVVHDTLATAAPTSVEVPTSVETPEAVNEKSIAVLPFVNMSDDTSNEYFSDGISEEILNSLAKIHELKVAGRTSSFSFKGEDLDLRQIGDALGVAHILEGSVRKSGDKVRITAQLIQVDDGFHLWSESYDRELTDVFAIQDEIATAILIELKARLLDTESNPVVVARTNSEAYDLYLLARQRIYERARLSLESAVELLDEAITLDANYAPAYAQRAIASMLLGDNNYGVIPKQQAESQARLYIDKALQLDPSNAEAWAALGLYHNNRIGENAQAIEALEKSLSINPNLINARNWLLASHSFMGNPGEALRIVNELVELDPLYRPGIANAISMYNQFGQQEKSLALLDRVEPFMPYDTNIIKGRADVFFSRGEYAKGLPLAEASLTQLPDQSTAKDMLSTGLLATHQYQRVADIGMDFYAIPALLNLGRNEEAMIRAFASVDSNGAGMLFYALNVLDRSEEIISFIDERWDSLDELEAELPPFGGIGYGLMNNVALAYARAGRQSAFDDALSRVRASHDKVIAQGARNSALWLNEAIYYSLSGDFATAMLELSKAIDAGLITSTRISFGFPALKPLEGDPGFENLQTRMIEHLNRERTALGLAEVAL